MKIFEIDILNAKNKKKILDVLAKEEEQALFIVGNLKNEKLASHIYVAQENDKIVGVCGFYSTFKSCNIFSHDENVSRMLGMCVAKRHKEISAVLGMYDMAKPAYEEMIKLGMKRAVDEPEAVFMELDMKNFVPYFSKKGKVKAIETQDVDAAILLLRQLHNVPLDLPISDVERAKMNACAIKFCLYFNNKMVSIASSNGLAIKVFQILGVTTDKEFRGQGFAKAVCSHLITFMKKQGAAKAVLFTGKNNTSAIRCYQHLGFKITGKYFFANMQG